MDKVQTVKFINNLFQDVWTELNESKIAKYYDKDVVAIFGNQKATYNDIVQRLKYVKSNYARLTNKIEDIVIEDNKVSVRLTQEYQSLNDNVNEICQIIAIYQINEGKISKLWGCIDPNINYFKN